MNRQAKRESQKTRSLPALRLARHHPYHRQNRCRRNETIGGEHRQSRKYRLRDSGKTARREFGRSLPGVVVAVGRIAAAGGRAGAGGLLIGSVLHAARAAGGGAAGLVAAAVGGQGGG